MIHNLPKDIRICLPEQFNDPFRYQPHPLVRIAAEMLIERISGNEELHNAFCEGKMLGVLIVRIPETEEIGYIAGFSGNAGGRSNIEGFVPPIFDLLDPKGHFKLKEAEITELNLKIASLENSDRLKSLKSDILHLEKQKEEEINRQKVHMAMTKRERDEIRAETSDPARLDVLLKESQFEKAELRRIKLRWEAEIYVKRNELSAVTDEIASLKNDRAIMSDELQKWIFRQYIVHDSYGTESSIYRIFSDEGIIPPGGTGECAAPKLIEYAYRNGLHPLAMGEFWYGDSPDTAVRTHGHFYPSCTSKCGPLLKFMLNGMKLEERLPCTERPTTVYEDDYMIVIDKPSGMPSVPGLDGRISAFEILKASDEELYSVHRLDMDTSGIIVFAKTAEAEVNLKKQFEEHTVRKTYKARLSPADTHRFAGNTPILKPGDKGTVELPLSPDYDERPRQKVDKSQGKPSLTEYEVLSVNEDGTTDILFHPHTGRTHQLRVHSAHIMGLGRPILGDLLYGGCSGASEKGLRAANLCLHALRITFRHPSSDEEITLQV